MQEKRFTVLVVDDDEGVRDSLKVILEDDYDVWAVDGGKQALHVFMNLKPDLVFLDLILPDMGGLEVLKRMKMMSSATPVVIFTAYSNIGNALHAIESGASDYIPKPFGVEDIRRETSDLLHNRVPGSLDGALLRQRWLTWKRTVRERFLTSAFVPTA